MKVCLIAPDSMLAWTKQGTMHFILSRIVDDTRIRKFFADEKMYKMLDNGVYETGFPLPGDGLLQIAREVKANEIVAPDYFREREWTFNATKEFIETFDPRSKGFKVCVVPQAKEPLEYAAAYKDMKRLEVDVIALPIWLQKYFKARPSVVGYLRKKKIWDETKEHHLLGLDGVGEIYAYGPEIIRSVDTSLPFSLTHNAVFSSFGDSDGKRVPMDRSAFQQMQEKLLSEHINELLQAAKFV